jgi:histidyl-tRNA synthetase
MNPLRLLDCKKDSCAPIAERSPRTVDYLCDECSAHFERLGTHLNSLGLPFEVNHRLVRGLDYYTKTVFEIAPRGEAAAQATIGAGGRYDDLIEQLGGRATPGIGFATGSERIVLNLKKQNVEVPEAASPSVYIVFQGEAGRAEAVKLASALRRSGCSVVSAFGDRRLKAQLRHADSSGAYHAVIIGETEVESGTAVVKDMHEGGQRTVRLEDVISVLKGS